MVVDGTFFPKFDQETYHIERQRILNEIKTGLTQERVDSLNALARMNGMPWLGVLVPGSVEQVQTYTRSDCAEFHRNYYTHSNTCVVLVGDVEHDRDVAKVENLLSGAPIGRLELPTLEKQKFQSGHFRKQSDFQENEGCARVTVCWPGVNYADPKRSYATRIAMRALADIVVPQLITAHGLYNAQLYRNGSLDFTPVNLLKLEGGDKNTVLRALQRGLGLITDPETAAALSTGHEQAIQREEISTRVNQPTIQHLATQLNDMHMIGAPLDLFGRYEVAHIQKVTPEDVWDVVMHLAEDPIFLGIRGHEDALGIIPSVDEVGAWRARPSIAPRGFGQVARGIRNVAG
jgi:hypothetical protein